MTKIIIDVTTTANHLSGCKCTGCGEELDRATGTPGAPNPGDIMICLHCGAISIVADDRTFRAPTEEERRALRQDAHAAFMQSVVLSTIALNCKGRG